MNKYFFTNCWVLKVEGNILDDSYSGKKGADIWHKKSELYARVIKAC